MRMQDQLNEIIKETITPLMKQERFKKSNKNFYHSFPELGWCMNIKSGKWSTAEHVEFTIETGIFVPYVHEITTKKPSPIFPREIDALIRLRITELKGLKNDPWYVLNQNTDMEYLKKELKQDIEHVVLPHFKQFYTLQDVINVMKRILKCNKRVVGVSELPLAVMLIKAGEVKEAENILKRRLGETSDFGREQVKRIARDLNISLE